MTRCFYTFLFCFIVKCIKNRDVTTRPSDRINVVSMWHKTYYRKIVKERKSRTKLTRQLTQVTDTTQLKQPGWPWVVRHRNTVFSMDFQISPRKKEKSRPRILYRSNRKYIQSKQRTRTGWIFHAVNCTCRKVSAKLPVSYARFKYLQANGKTTDNQFSVYTNNFPIESNECIPSDCC